MSRHITEHMLEGALAESRRQMAELLEAQKTIFDEYPGIVESIYIRVRTGEREVTRTQVEEMFSQVGTAEEGLPLTEDEVRHLSYQLLDYMTKTDQLHYAGSHWEAFDLSNPKHHLFG